MLKQFLVLATLVLATLILVPATAMAETPIPVVASFSVLGDIVRQVGGSHVTVETLVGPDGDAHVFQPSPGDVAKLSAARVFVINGLGLEGWLSRLSGSAHFTGVQITASTGVAPLADVEADALKGGTDPHAWQNIHNGEIYVRNIVAGLKTADPAHAADYDRQAAAYLDRLKTLDDWVRAQIATVPAAKRKVITTHDAFQYFGHAYGVTFRAPVGLNEDSEPSAADVANLIRQIKAEHIKALFIENMTDPRLLEQLAQETGTTLGGTLYADALSKPGAGADTYEGMFRHNLPLMVAAMGKN